MEVRHRILEFSTSPRYEALKNELQRLSVPFRIERLGRRSGRDYLSLECLVAEDDPRFPEISALVEKYGFHSQVGVHFTEKEVEEAEWVWAATGEYQYPEPGYPGYLQATYDLRGYCHRCGIGAEQNRPFRLRRDFSQKSNQFLGLHWTFDVIFLRPPAKALLEKAGITGIAFDHPVRHGSGEPLTSVYQIRIAAISKAGLALQDPSPVTCKPDNEESHAPGLERNRNLLPDPPYCHRVKYHHPRREPITLRAQALDGLPDVAFSYEYFGSGAEAHRLVLMRQTVVTIIRANQLRGLKFTPIRILG